MSGVLSFVGGADSGVEFDGVTLWGGNRPGNDGDAVFSSEFSCDAGGEGSAGNGVVWDEDTCGAGAVEVDARLVDGHRDGGAVPLGCGH